MSTGLLFVLRTYSLWYTWKFEVGMEIRGWVDGDKGWRVGFGRVVDETPWRRLRTLHGVMPLAFK
jgi:hypothetical protein